MSMLRRHLPTFGLALALLAAFLALPSLTLAEDHPAAAATEAAAPQATPESDTEATPPTEATAGTPDAQGMRCRGGRGDSGTAGRGQGGCGCGGSDSARQGRMASCGHGGGCAGGGMCGGEGMMGGRMRGGGKGMGGGHAEEMAVYRELLDNHQKIERTLEEVEGGVVTTTTTIDPDLVPVLQRHVRQMAALLESGQPIRRWDPLFAELFRHHEAVSMTIEDLPDGVRVTETSADPEVARLVRAHARKVQEFVARGDDAYREETPLPEGYAAPAIP